VTASCPICGAALEIALRDVITCWGCLSPLAVWNGEVVRDEMREPVYVKEIKQ
jgi:hypothetical protein